MYICFAQVERLKRINKLYSNDTFHVRKSLLIPHVNDDSESSQEPTSSLNSSSIYSDSDDSDDDDNTSKSRTADVNMISKNIIECPLMSSCKENEERSSNSGYDTLDNKSETVKCFDSIFSKIDGQIKDYKDTVRSRVGSEAYNDFNEMLAKIDNQIQDQRTR